MGRKMTSTMYGLKVKEHTNHADYEDIFGGVALKLYYDEQSHTWTLKSNYDRMFMDGTQYHSGDTIATFQNGWEHEYKIMGQYDQDDTELYRNIMYRVNCYMGTEGAGKAKQHVSISGGQEFITYDKESVCKDILHTHTKVYYNGKWHKAMYLVYNNPSVANCWAKKVGSLAITYADPYWFLMTTQSGIEYGGQTYGTRMLIRSWSPSDSVNMTLLQHTSRRRELKNPDVDKFDKCVYDVQCFAPDGQVTLTYEVNTVAQDSRTFYPSDSPVVFHNIEFRASSDKWTIYSKCGFIRFDGKTYKNNQSIFSVGFDENLHVEITDQSNIYEITKTTTYTVKSVQVGSIGYKVWTASISKTLKIEKSTNGVAEPWVSINFYDAMYKPVNVDDLIVEFSNIDMCWYLKSNNDDLYSSGSNYKKGELIATWGYNTIQNLSNITVLTSSGETGIEIKAISTGDIPYTGNDIDEIYDDGIRVCHSSTKGLWEIKSVNDRTYYNGIQFLTGQTIISFKDKTVLDQFSILVQKESGNSMYYCYTSVDIINNVTQFSANGTTWSDKSMTDANKTVILTKDTAKSLYGYIWQKEEGPGPGPTPIPTGYNFTIICIPRINNNWCNLLNINRQTGAVSVTISNTGYYSFSNGSVGKFFQYYRNTRTQEIQAFSRYTQQSISYITTGTFDFYSNSRNISAGGYTFPYAETNNSSDNISIVISGSGTHDETNHVFIEKYFIQRVKLAYEGYNASLATNAYAEMEYPDIYVNNSIGEYMWVSNYYATDPSCVELTGRSSGVGWQSGCYEKLDDYTVLWGFPKQGLFRTEGYANDPEEYYDTNWYNDEANYVASRIDCSKYLFLELNCATLDMQMVKVPDSMIEEIKQICMTRFGISDARQISFSRADWKTYSSFSGYPDNKIQYFVYNGTAYIFTEYMCAEAQMNGHNSDVIHYDDDPNPWIPFGWETDPVRILFTYNKLEGVKYYDISNSNFYTHYRKIYFSNTSSSGGRNYHRYTRRNRNNWLKTIIFKGEIYFICDYLPYQVSWHYYFPEVPEIGGYYEADRATCIYKFSMVNGVPTFLLMRTFTLENSFIEIGNISNRNEKIKIFMTIDQNDESYTSAQLLRNLLYFNHIEMVDEKVRDYANLDGIFFYYYKARNQRYLLYFDNPLFDESDYNFYIDCSNFG